MSKGYVFTLLCSKSSAVLPLGQCFAFLNVEQLAARLSLNFHLLVTVRGECVQTNVAHLHLYLYLLLYVYAGLHISALRTGKCYFPMVLLVTFQCLA